MLGTSKTVNIIPTPSNPNTTNITSTKAKLNWTIVSCADYYSIEYRVQGTTAWIKKKTTTGNVSSYTLKSLSASTTYVWKVAAVDSLNGINATSPYSDSVVFTTASSFAAFNENEQEQSGTTKNNLSGSDVALFPNPASSQVHIQLGNSIAKTSAQVNLILKDANGKIVWTATNINVGSLSSMNIDVSKLPNGIYLLQIIIGSDNSIITKKIIVSK